MWESGPNIFDYATSELSQDAFFCWFLSWASEDYKTDDFKSLHDSARQMIYKFFNDSGIKLGKTVKKFTSVEVTKQWNNIDLWIVINGKYNLVIEDKTKSNQHSNQLQRYKKHFQNKKDKTCFIYIKTGSLNEDIDADLQKASELGYIAYGLEDIYGMLKNIQTENAIFENYKARIENILYLEQIQYNFTEGVSCWKDFSLPDRLKKWKDNCLYYYYIKSLHTGYKNKFFALDIWIDNKNIDFCFHVIQNKEGKWIEDQKKFEKIFRKLHSELMNYFLDSKNGYSYNECYFEKQVQFNNIEEAEKLIFDEINKYILLENKQDVSRF